MTARAFTTVVFDLGGVLIDWDPRHLYRKLFDGDDEAMETFLAEVCTSEWNAQQDAGRSWTEATALLKAEHPHHARLIDAFHHRWPETMAGAIDGSVAILHALKRSGVSLYALTNFSHETFPVALERFDFLGLFEGIVVSGAEKIIKPDPRIYDLLVQRHGLRAESIVYIDDNAANVATARSLGMHGIHFSDPPTLEAELVGLGLLPS